MEDGTPIEAVVATLGIVGRLNQAQMNEFSINELSKTAVELIKMTPDLDKKLKIVYRLMKYLNSDEAEDFKSFTKGLSKKEKEKLIKQSMKTVGFAFDNSKDLFDGAMKGISMDFIFEKIKEA